MQCCNVCFKKLNDSTISNAIITEKYNELIASYADNMSVKNIKNRIKMYED